MDKQTKIQRNMPNGDKNMKRTPRFTNSTALNIQISDHLFRGQANL